MDINKHPLLKRMYELMVETEKLPAGDQQTKIVMMMSDIAREIEAFIDNRSKNKMMDINCIHGKPQGIGCIECFRNSVSGT